MVRRRKGRAGAAGAAGLSVSTGMAVTYPEGRGEERYRHKVGSWMPGSAASKKRRQAEHVQTKARQATKPALL